MTHKSTRDNVSTAFVSTAPKTSGAIFIVCARKTWFVDNEVVFRYRQLLSATKLLISRVVIILATLTDSPFL